MPKFQTLLGFPLSMLLWERHRGIDPRWGRTLVEANRDLVSWQRVSDGLKVIESIERYDVATGVRQLSHEGDPDDHIEGTREILHVSLSYPRMIPPWQAIRDVKDTFIGTDREAYMVFPPKDRYVNDNPTVLHLYCPLDGPVLPDLRKPAPDDGHPTL